MKTLRCLNLVQFIILAGIVFSSTEIQQSSVKVQDFISIGVDGESHLEQAQELLARSQNNLYHLRHKSSQLTKRLIFDLVHKELMNRPELDSAELTKTILAVSLNSKLDPLLLLSIIKTESRFRQKSVGAHGEIGLMQIRPETAEWMARRAKIRWRGKAALFEMEYNIRLGAEYLKYLRLRFGTDGQGYLSAYNMGVLKVRTLYKEQVRPNIYANRVLQNYLEYHQQYALFSSGKKLSFSLASFQEN